MRSLAPLSSRSKAGRNSPGKQNIIHDDKETIMGNHQNHPEYQSGGQWTLSHAQPTKDLLEDLQNTLEV